MDVAIRGETNAGGAIMGQPIARKIAGWRISRNAHGVH